MLLVYSTTITVYHVLGCLHSIIVDVISLRYMSFGELIGD